VLPAVPEVEPLFIEPLLLVPLDVSDEPVPLVLPVLLVGAVVLVPVALPLVVSAEWRLQADSISAALVAAIRAVRRRIESERMACCSWRLGTSPGQQPPCPAAARRATASS
jgi:hypothetical protein